MPAFARRFVTTSCAWASFAFAVGDAALGSSCTTTRLTAAPHRAMVAGYEVVGINFRK